MEENKMVKSKKMSKTSIAVIVLALLLVLSMVLGLTGAWFTNSGKNATADVNNLTFGTIGSVSVTITGAKHYDADDNLLDGESGTGHGAVRDVLPGDKVTAGGFELAYASSDTPTDETVWYLIKDQAGTYYYINSSHVLVAISGNNDEAKAAAYAAITNSQNKITKSTPLTVSAEVLTIQIGSLWYNLDGSNDGTGSAAGTSHDVAKESWQIGELSNSATVQGQDLNGFSTYLGSVVYNSAGTTYGVAVIQTTNLTDAEDAFAGLKIAVDAVMAS
jgi:hypothetical protein